MVTNKKGFTLIELLVVIAIIGILSGLIIVNLSGATDAAHNAKIKANLDQLRAAAEVYKTNNESYGSTLAAPTAVCANAGTFMASGADGEKACTAAHNEYTTGTIVVNISGTSTGAYCVSHTLIGGGGWCVDSTGYSGPVSVCDLATRDCAAD